MTRRMSPLILTAVALVAVACESNDRYVAEVQGSDPRARDIKKAIVDLGAVDASVRAQAAQYLGEVQATEKGALNALANTLTDPNRDVRLASAVSLRRIGTVDALERLQSAANKGWPEARDVYNATAKDLRDQTRGGDPGARNILEQLGEEAIPVPEQRYEQ